MLRERNSVRRGANQSNPSLFRFNDEVGTLTWWAEKIGIERSALYRRIAPKPRGYGMTFEEAITRPKHEHSRKTALEGGHGVLIEYNGKKMTRNAWAKELNLSIPTIYRRLASGLSVEEALTIPKGKVPVPEERRQRQTVGLKAAQAVRNSKPLSQSARDKIGEAHRRLAASRTEDERKLIVERIVRQVVESKRAKRQAARQRIEEEAPNAGIDLHSEGWGSLAPIQMLTDEKAWELYLTKGWTPDWIASRYQLTYGAVRNRLLKHPDFKTVAEQRRTAHTRSFGDRVSRSRVNSALCCEYEGESLTIQEWSAKTGLTIETIDGRLRRGWSMAATLTTTSEETSRYEYNKMTLTVREWSEQTGLPRSVINDRLRKGWTIEKTLTEPTAEIHEYEGERLTVPEWSEKTGLPQSTIYGRLKLGWSVKDALTLPLNTMLNVTRYEYDGKCLALQEWAAELNMSVHTLRSRFRLKWSIEDALARPVAHKTTRSEKRR